MAAAQRIVCGQTAIPTFLCLFSFTVAEQSASAQIALWPLLKEREKRKGEAVQAIGPKA